MSLPELILVVIGIIGIIGTVITIILIAINNLRQKIGLTPDVEIIHRRYLRFEKILDFQLYNKGLERAKNINVTHESEIGGFELSGYAEELLPRDQFFYISLKWVEPRLIPYEGKVKVKVSYESFLKKWIFFKDKKTHEIEYYIKNGKVTLLKNGN